MNQQNNFTFTNYDIENYLKAISVLYRGTDSEMKNQSNKFLINFEKQISSWVNAIQILKMDDLEEEVINITNVGLLHRNEYIKKEIEV